MKTIAMASRNQLYLILSYAKYSDETNRGGKRMIFKHKNIEVYTVKEFLAGNRRKSSDVTLHSGLLPGITINSLFDLSPQMTGLYAVILGAGTLAIPFGTSSKFKRLRTAFRMFHTVGDMG